jgi:hypothetical protein
MDMIQTPKEEVSDRGPRSEWTVSRLTLFTTQASMQSGYLRHTVLGGDTTLVDKS